VPVEEVVEMKAGQKAISERKFFPGYVLVEMEMTDDSWHLVKSTPKVTGSWAARRTSRRRSRRRKSTRSAAGAGGASRKPRPKVLFEMGEAVRVKEGPVHRLPRQRGGRELREEQAPRVGDDFRSFDAGRARFFAGRKA
jgi:transcriptional antiterminator NusG